MNELILLLVVGGVLLAVLLAALLRGVPRPQPAGAVEGRLAQVVPLPGVSFLHSQRLFDSADYDALPEPIAAAVRDERRRLALLWLRLMREDVRTLWRFRRLLAVHGVSGGPSEELRVALAGLGAVTLIHMLRLGVALAGPFAVAQFCQASRARVESVRHASAALFGRVPPSQAAEFERLWAASLTNAPAVFVR